VAGHPLQHRVAQQNVDVRPGGVVAHVTEPELDARGVRAPDHLRRRVDAGDHRVRPALGQGGGEQTGPAAQVDDGSGPLDGDPGDQVGEGPAAFGAVPAVDDRVPHEARA
jgi:hypothetical protein